MLISKFLIYAEWNSKIVFLGRERQFHFLTSKETQDN